MKGYINYVFGLIFYFFASISSQGQTEKSVASSSSPNLRIMFYNTENFYNTFDDPKTNDNEFLPSSPRHWTLKRYQTKLNNIYKVIISMGAQPPSIIGLSEIENRKVLNDLAQNTPLIKFNYQIIHKDSPDPRGIDVGVLYRPDFFKPLNYSFIRISFSSDSARRTRDIIYIKGIALGHDTIHVFVNHWPSRMGGQARSEILRDETAKILRNKIDSLFFLSKNNKIIIIGDFNDDPDDESIQNDLKAIKVTDKIVKGQLYDLSERWLKDIFTVGTIKYKGKWSIFDQIIVSSGLLVNNSKGLKCFPSSAGIYFPNFLLTEDKNYSGKTPFRTYNGYKYIGGFSDHLPIFIDLFYKSK